MRHEEASAEQRAWENACSLALTSNAMWKLDAYRAAMFLLHVSRSDCRVIPVARSTGAIAEQLTRAAASVSANLGEGYSRSTRADRLRFFDYALGSTRECITWYEAMRDALPDDLINERLILLTRIRSLMLGLMRSIRERKSTAGRFQP